MDLLRCVGGCVPLFLFAVFLDVTGLVLIFVGIFADPRLEGRYYGDFLIYTGALLVFASLASWLMWYVGNVPVRDDDGPGKRSSFALLARKLSESLSQTLKGEEGAKCVRDQDRCSEAGSSPPRKASRVTWGKSTSYSNQGYDDSMDSPKEERKERTPDQGCEESVDTPDEDSKETPPDQGYDIFMDSPKEDRKETPPDQGYDIFMDSPKEDRKETPPDQGYDIFMDSPKEDRKETPPDQGYDIFMDSPKEDRKETTT